MSWLIGFTFLIILIVLFLKVPSTSIDGSIVMAIGILINSAVQQEAALKKMGPFLTAILLAFLVRVFIEYMRELLQGRFYENRLRHPISGFTTGTLVAGISVAAISIVNELPHEKSLALVLFIVNLLFWVLYFIQFVWNYRRLFSQPVYLKYTHGAILLSCVATQSIVVAGNTLFPSAFPKPLSMTLILLGLILYFLGFLLILLRYLRDFAGNLADEWKNTNCILHGAMSITGLASSVSQAISPQIISAMWLWALLVFAIVELIEVWRASQRIQRYGWQRGIFSYSVTQWARNFTFGMLLAFTLHLALDGSFLATTLFQSLRQSIITGGVFVVLTDFAVETCLFCLPRSHSLEPLSRGGNG